MGDIKTLVMDGRLYNVEKWIEENKKWFLPPVCNKMMHYQGQMKHFFAGGPNQRKDFHIECGDELFLQIKGDMVLKIVEQNRHRDVHIKEGELFLLPARVAHSPQRFEDTVGMVIERDRDKTELDGLRYFIEKDGELTLDSLYEKWFYCEDLGSQLASIIKEFFASEQYKTGKPLPGSIPEKCPHELDSEVQIEEPLNFNKWIERHLDEINENGRLAIFDVEKYQFQVYMYGKGKISEKIETAESWIWQWEGTSHVEVNGEEILLSKGDSFLVPIGAQFTVKQELGSLALVCYQDPTKAPTYPKHIEL